MLASAAGGCLDRMIYRPKSFIINASVLLLIIAKFGYFYGCMGVTDGLAACLLVSTVATLVFFAAFRRKLIPLVMYLIWSGLLLADILYHEYLNSYLSVKLLLLGEVLGTITGNIASIMKAEYLLVFIDAVVMLALILFNKRIWPGGGPRQKTSLPSENVTGSTFKHKTDLASAHKTGTETTSNTVLRLVKTSLAAFLCSALVINPLGGPIFAAVGANEPAVYHARDILGAAKDDSGEYYISTGSYEKSLEEDDSKTSLFGAAEGRNLIVIQLEAFQNFAINRKYNGQELTPFLNSLISGGDTLYFDHYYYQIGAGNTSDAEFATNNSLIGSTTSYTYKLYEKNTFRGLPWLLREQGYSTAVMHAYDSSFWNREKMYPKEGFEAYYDDSYYGIDSSYDGEGFVTVNDENFYKKSIAKLKEMKSPFYAFMVSLSGHHPYVQPEANQMLDIAEEDKGTLTADYLQCVRYEDYALEKFFKELKDSELYDNSIICIYGDHYGLSCEDEGITKTMDQLLGEDYSLKWHFNIPLIINIPGEKVGRTVSTAGGQLDFLPTIAYLLGLDKLDTIYLGQNLLTAKEGYSFIQSFMLKGSFINDQVVFQRSRDGVLSNSTVYDLDSGKRIKNGIEKYEDLSIKSKELSDLSQFYLDSNIIDKVYNKSMTIEEIIDAYQTGQSAPAPQSIETLEPSRLANKITEQKPEKAAASTTEAATEIETETVTAEAITLATTVSIKNTGDVKKWLEANESGRLVVSIDPGEKPYVSKSRKDLEKDDTIKVINALYKSVAELKADKTGKSTAGSETKTTDGKAAAGSEKKTTAGKEDENGGRIADVIVRCSNMKYYEAAIKAGFTSLIFEPEFGVYDQSDYSSFFAAEHPWAILVNSEDADDPSNGEEYSWLLASGNNIYEVSGAARAANDEESPLISLRYNADDHSSALPSLDISAICDGRDKSRAIVIILCLTAFAGLLSQMAAEIRHLYRRRV